VAFIIHKSIIANQVLTRLVSVVCSIAPHAQAGTPTVKGYDFEGPLDLQAMLDCMMTSGFQATTFGQAVEAGVGTLHHKVYFAAPKHGSIDDDSRYVPP
jgi:hypothetical protein